MARAYDIIVSLDRWQSWGGELWKNHISGYGVFARLNVLLTEKLTNGALVTPAPIPLETGDICNAGLKYVREPAGGN